MMRFGGWRPWRAALSRFGPTEAGAAAVEFVLIVVLVAVGMLAGPEALGAGDGSWSSTSTKITNAMSERSP
jgi:Flp pilus assembly pilin Flp